MWRSTWQQVYMFKFRYPDELKTTSETNADTQILYSGGTNKSTGYPEESFSRTPLGILEIIELGLG